MENKSILLGIIIIVVVVLLTGCAFNNVMDSSDFHDHLGALGYTVNENADGEFECKEYLVATKEDVPFKVEYYEFNNEKAAEEASQNLENNLKDYITSDSSNKKDTGVNHSKLTAITDNEYIVISRIKNTLIFINGLKEYQTEIEELLEDINY